MFAELIRRKFGGARIGSSDAAFESTTVSLSSAVPRPVRVAWSFGKRLRAGQLAHDFFAEHAHEPARLAFAVGLGGRLLYDRIGVRWMVVLGSLALIASSWAMSQLTPTSDGT